MEYQDLIEAGFSEDEVKNYYQEKLSNAGFTNTEINQYIYEKSGKELKSLEGDEQSESVKNVAQEVADVSFKRAVELGWQKSVTGMVARQKLPDELSEAEQKGMSIWDKAVSGATTALADIPVYLMNAKVGSATGAATGFLVGGPGGAAIGAGIGGAAGAFGITDAMRQALIDGYTKGEVKTPAEFLERVQNQAVAFVKGSTVGVALKGISPVAKNAEEFIASTFKNSFGKYVSKTVPFLAETGTLTAVGSGVEGQIPSASDFAETALVIGANKFFGFIPSEVSKKLSDEQLNNNVKIFEKKLMDHYAKTGEHPYDVLKQAEENPAILDKLFNEGKESIIEGYTKTINDPFGGTPTDEMSRFLGNYIIQRGAALKNKNGDVIVQGRLLQKEKGTNSNFGFTKAIFKHNLTSEQMSKLPEYIYNYEPIETSDTRYVYRIKEGKDDIKIIFDNYNTDHSLISMYIEDRPHDKIYSKEKASSVKGKIFSPSPNNYTSDDYYLDQDGGSSIKNNLSKKNNSVNSESYQTDQKIPENKNSQVAPEGEVRASDAVKISTAFKNMAEKIKVPVRYGKIKGTSNVLGQYYPDKEMIRVRYANDIETLSHEVGHHLEKIMFGDIGAEQTKSFQSELEKIATKTNMRDKERGNRAEGFAEFISWFVANPQKAKELCPKFYEYFDDRMKFEMPEQYDLLMETRDTITKYVEQPDVMKVLSKISVGEKEQKAPIDLKEKLIQNFYDDIYPLKKITEDLGIDPFSHQSPYLQARMLRGGIEAKASYGLKEDQIGYDGQVVGPSLAKILEPVKGSLLSKGKLNKDTLRAYMVSRRALEKEVQGIKTGIDIKAAMNTVKEYNDQYKDIANALAEFAKNDLKLLVDSGLLSKESYNNITAKNEFYVPMNRVMDIDIEGGIGGKRLKPSNAIRKMKGSTRDIIDPLESIIRNHINIVAQAERNRVAKSIADLSKIKGSGKYVFEVKKNSEMIKIPNGMDLYKEDAFGNFEQVNDFWIQTDKVNDKTQMIAYKDGKAKVYEITPEIAAIVTNMSGKSATILSKVLGAPAQSLRLGATAWNSTFAFKNFIRDTQLALLTTKGGYKPWKDIIPNVISMIKNDEYYKAYKRSGASMITFVNTNRNVLQGTLDDLVSTGYFDDIRNCIDTKDYVKLVQKGVLNPVINGLSWMGDKSETLTRFGEFKASMKGKEFTYENIEKAGFNAREITLDFAKGGTTVKAINTYAAFFNANVLGTVKAINAIKENPVRAVRIMGTLGVIGALANWDFDKWDVKDEIKETLEVVRNTNYTLSLPYRDKETGIEDRYVLRIPKAQQIGWIATAAENITYAGLAKLKGKDRDDFILSLAKAGFDEFNIVPNINFAQMPFELMANYSSYTGRPIVPASMEGILPEYQYKDDTSEISKFTSKTLANIFGDGNSVSPIKIDYAVRGWTGGFGQGVLKFADKVGQAIGLFEADKIEKKLDNSAFFRAFVSRVPSANSESINKFFENAKRAKEKVKTFKYQLKRMDLGVVEQKDYWLAFEGFEKIESAINELSGVAAQVEMSEASKNEKRRNLDQIYYSMIELSREANDAYKKMEAISKQMKKKK